MFAYETSDCRVGRGQTAYRAIVEAYQDVDISPDCGIVAVGVLLDSGCEQTDWRYHGGQFEGDDVARVCELLNSDGQTIGTFYELRD